MKNKGTSIASNYIVKLFIGSETQQHISYENPVDFKNISINTGVSNTFNLIWEDCTAGRYLVGVNIYVNDTYQDGNRFDNHLLVNRILIIEPPEEDSGPIIENITIAVTPELIRAAFINRFFKEVSKSDEICDCI